MIHQFARTLIIHVVNNDNGFWVLAAETLEYLREFWLFRDAAAANRGALCGPAWRKFRTTGIPININSMHLYQVQRMFSYFPRETASTDAAGNYDAAVVIMRRQEEQSACRVRTPQAQLLAERKPNHYSENTIQSRMGSKIPPTGQPGEHPSLSAFRNLTSIKDAHLEPRTGTDGARAVILPQRARYSVVLLGQGSK